MALSSSPSLTARVLLCSALTLGVAWLAGSACAQEEDKELARALIGPEGGSLSGAGFTVEIPAGALRAETEIVLTQVGRDISVNDYAQRGSAVLLEPEGLRLDLPAVVSVNADVDGTSLLVQANEQTTAYPGVSAYPEYLGAMALADTGLPTLTLLEPELGSSPSSPAGSHVDNLHFDLELDGTHRVDVVLTAWDYSGAQRVLNGEGHCGFKVVQLEGGSLTTGCASGSLTASINSAGDQLSFDVLPFLAPALDEPVSVGVLIGDGELNYALGTFSFKTGDCYLEECSGHGTCESDGTPGCVCDEGYAPPEDDALSCLCVPQCDGRQCGSNSCGGSCGSCGEGETCLYNEGQCVTEDNSEDEGTSEESTTTDSGDTGETDTTEDTGDTGTEDTGGTETDTTG
ncbi:hypothetical protein G6O69_31395 [Pseudenhygromyxa sp. WMMC2535]|uniref:hypothetical protein n=1 Tax=Pseudenhygromyxa sp. WMMC2535 TaxID=2712867 RepID=UPI001556E7A6|nr:hypothetical protein [Pseudenhygromyxa sp. WMMC2535]NVB42370.1 hypothetical protein [Pseudenhygromyxa sp. WMMC2535]